MWSFSQELITLVRKTQSVFINSIYVRFKILSEWKMNTEDGNVNAGGGPCPVPAIIWTITILNI